MIYIIVGPSHAGKTSFTANSFIKGEIQYYKDIVGVTECDTCYLIGNYAIDKRARGSDTVARQHIKFIVDQVDKLVAKNDGKDIVLEGDKICSRNIFNHLKKYDCKLYYIKCSVETSILRNKAFNSTVNDSVLKRTATKAKNFYIEYAEDFDGEMIETDAIQDFTQFSKDNPKFIFTKGYKKFNLF